MVQVSKCGRSKSKSRFEKKISEMRSTCESHTNERVEKASAVKRKRAAEVIQAPKPTNVKTFAKKKNGGMIESSAKRL